MSDDKPSDELAPVTNQPLSGEQYIVGVGASAGGLEPLEEFFQAFPDHPSVALVVVQHLSPDYKSQMDEILRRKTKIPIHQVTDGVELKAGHIYLIPPAKTMIVSHGKLLLTDKDPSGISFPIDTFFRSLAQEASESSIAVILSGTGSDGSRGIVDVHEAGGLVIVQDENSAKFAGMPVSALQTGVVDLVLEAEEMAAVIEKYAARAFSQENIAQVIPPPVAANALDMIFSALHSRFDIDFSQYKSNTISRRIERRIELTNEDDIEDYAERLADDPAEVERLYHDLLIGVTKFFRDQEAFDELNESVLKKLVAEEEEQVRVWVPGCASGEEPYTIAMLLLDEYERLDKVPNFKIFASDVHAISIRTASAGRYPKRSLNRLPRELVKRYFTQEGDEFVVASKLRSHIVFTEHNLMTGVPFTRLSLITCRNLLIYFQVNAQKKAFSLFHFGLQMGGYLMLGPSESLGELESEFTVINSKWKLFQKRRDSRLMRDYGASIQPPMAGLTSRRSDDRTRTQFSLKTPWERTLSESDLLRAYDDILRDYMPESFLVDDRFRLIHSFAGAERYLRIRGGRSSQLLTELIEEELKSSVSGALQHCAKNRKPVKYAGIARETEAGTVNITVEVRPYRDKQSALDAFIVTLNSSPLKPASPASAKEETMVEEEGSVVSFSHNLRTELEAELRFTKENLQATIEEFETSNEELQAANEELVASNEELQSSNEELHSVNEELDTVNAEYQKKIDELSELTDDTDNLLKATSVGVIFLDNHFCIRKITPEVAKNFRIIESDLHRDIRSFSHLLGYDEFVDDLEKVATNGEAIETEVVLNKGRQFLLRISPYQGRGSSDDLVLSLVEITSVRVAEERLEDLSNLVESSHDAIIGFSSTGVITAWNQGAADLYGFTEKDALGQTAVDFIIPLSEAAGFLRQLDQVLEGQKPPAVTSERLTKAGHTISVSQRLSTATNSSSQKTVVSSIERDITDEVLVRRDRDRLASVLEEASDFVGICDAKGRARFINKAGLQMVGLPEGADLKGMMIQDFHAPEVREVLNSKATKIARENGSWRGETKLLKADGTVMPASQLILFHEGREGEPSFFSTIVRDLSAELAAFQKIERAQQKASKIAHTLSGVVENFPETLIVVDASQKIEFASPDAHSLLQNYQGAGLPLGLTRIVAEAIETNTSYLPEDFRGVEGLLMSDGTTRYFLSRVNVLHDAAGALTGAIIVIQDVTEFRLLDELKTTLIGTVSHELKNPVAGMLMSLSLLQEERVGDLTSNQRAIVETALTECERVSGTINSLLELTRFEESSRNLGEQRVKVQSLLARAIKNHSAMADQKNISLQSRMEAACDVLECDKDRIGMVLDNLVSNAIKHSPADSTVSIIAQGEDEEYVEILVVDAGPGIPVEFRDKLFTKFFKVPGNDVSGSGLGLNIAKQFVEAHGGEIGVENNEDEGCTFMVKLPCVSATNSGK